MSHERLSDQPLLKALFGPAIYPKLLLMTLWVAVLVLVQVYQYSFESLSEYGISPRDPGGLPGILLAPFIHADFSHLASNAFSLFLSGTFLLVFFDRIAGRVLLGITLLGGLAVWLLARPSYHIGASGVIYGIVGFLLISGAFRRDRSAAALALMVLFLNQGLLAGFAPKQGISWESHLFYFIAGGVLAAAYRKVPMSNITREHRPVLEDEDEEHEESSPPAPPHTAPPHPPREHPHHRPAHSGSPQHASPQWDYHQHVRLPPHQRPPSQRS